METDKMACDNACPWAKGQESQVTALAGSIARIDKDVNGNGQPGIKQTMASILSDIAVIKGVELEREKQAEKRHSELIEINNTRHYDNAAKIDRVSAQIGRKTLLWTIAGVMLAGASVLVAALAIYITVRLTRVSNLDNLMHSQTYTADNSHQLATKEE